MASQDNPNAPPATATDAVLVVSEEMPEGTQKVEELDFDDIEGSITAENLFNGMKYMGFQASSLGESVRIINDMVGHRAVSLRCDAADMGGRGRGETPKQGTRPPFSSATRRT